MRVESPDIMTVDRLNGDGLNKPNNESEKGGKIKMVRTIGLVSSINIIVGSVIGSGIFVSPTGILREVGSFGVSLVIWAACGVFTFLGAYCYAELGTMMERSGGDYSYVLEAFGPLMGFLRLWLEVMVVRPTSCAILAMTFAEYVMQAVFPDCDRPETAKIMLGIVALLLLCMFNAISVRLSTTIQNVFTFAKLLTLGAIIIIGVVMLCMGKVEAFDNCFEDTNWNPGSLVSAFYVGMFAYSGWNYLNCMIEEMINPRRDLPIAIVFSCLLCTLIYLMANISYVTLVPLNLILETPAVAVYFVEQLYKPIAIIVPILVACSCFGGMNGTIMTTSRMFFVASQENQMPKMLCFLHHIQLTPIPAIIFTGAVSMVYIVIGDIYELMAYAGFVQALAIGVTVLIVIIFRFTRPDAERPVKAPMPFAIIFVAVTAFLLIFAFYGNPSSALKGCVIILTGIPFYVVGCAWTNKPKSFTRRVDQFSIWIQKLFKVVPSD